MERLHFDEGPRRLSAGVLRKRVHSRSLSGFRGLHFCSLCSKLVAQESLKGGQREPHGAKKEPMEPKGCQSEPNDVPKHPLGNMVEQIMKKKSAPTVLESHF